MKSLDLLDRLVAFQTVSDQSNLSLIAFVQSYLAERGIESMLVHDRTGAKANLFATTGPADGSGVLLSAHTDVVPVAGQVWTSDPFVLTEREGRLFGRGAADMKSFVACVLRAADVAARRRLSAPLHIALSHDEEIGCVGVRSLLDVLKGRSFDARLCIVGEPTSMGIALGHKGKVAARATFRGSGGHSALAPKSVNAMHLAADFVGCLRRRQSALATDGVRDDAYDVPYTTIHAGVFKAGTALNLVPDIAEVDFEIRSLAEDRPDAIMDALVEDAEDIARNARVDSPLASAEIEVRNSYPGLATPEQDQAVGFVRELTGGTPLTKVAYGTEGGLFHQILGIPTIVCGPGSMAQGHIADEFIAREQLAACDAMLDRLLDTLTASEKPKHY